MHAQHETARCLLGRRADYVISAIKDNQETILEDLKAIDFSDAPWHETVEPTLWPMPPMSVEAAAISRHWSRKRGMSEVRGA